MNMHQLFVTTVDSDTNYWWSEWCCSRRSTVDISYIIPIEPQDQWQTGVLNPPDTRTSELFRPVQCAVCTELDHRAGRR